MPSESLCTAGITDDRAKGLLRRLIDEWIFLNKWMFFQKKNSCLDCSDASASGQMLAWRRERIKKKLRQTAGKIHICEKTQI